MNGFAIGGYGYGFGGGWGDYGAGYGFGFGGGIPVSSNTDAYGWPGFQGVAGFVNAGGSATQFAGWGSGGARVGGGLWNYGFGWDGILAGLSATIDTVANGIYFLIGDRHQLVQLYNWGQAPIGDYAPPWAIGNSMDIEAEGEVEGEAEEDETEPEQKTGDVEKPAEPAKAPEAAAAAKKTPVEIARAALPTGRQGEAEALIAAMEKRNLPRTERLIKRVAKLVGKGKVVDQAVVTIKAAWVKEVAAAGAARKKTTPATPAEPATVEAPSGKTYEPHYYTSQEDCEADDAVVCIKIGADNWMGQKEATAPSP